MGFERLFGVKMASSRDIPRFIRPLAPLSWKLWKYMKTYNIFGLISPKLYRHLAFIGNAKQAFKVRNWFVSYVKVLPIANGCTFKSMPLKVFNNRSIFVGGNDCNILARF